MIPSPSERSAPTVDTITQSVGSIAVIDDIETKLIDVSLPNALMQERMHISFPLGVYNKNTNYIQITTSRKNLGQYGCDIYYGYIIVDNGINKLEYRPSEGIRHSTLAPLEQSRLIEVYAIPKEATGRMYWYSDYFQDGDFIRYQIIIPKQSGGGEDTDNSTDKSTDQNSTSSD